MNKLIAFLHVINRYAKPSYKEWKVDAFASTIKTITAFLFNCTEAELEDREFRNRKIPFLLNIEGNDITYAQFFQKFGTDTAHLINPYIWIDKLYRKCWIKSREDNKEYLINNLLITDVRFKREAEFIKSKGGIIIRFIGDHLGDSKEDTRNPNHESENVDSIPIEMFDYVINLKNHNSPQKVSEFLKYIIVNEKII